MQADRHSNGLRIGIVSIQKNRAPWLHEWVAFHRLVGFTNFYIYAHNCLDNSAEVLSQLSQRYALEAFIVNTTENQVQLKVYQHAYEQFGHACDWLAFIDGDEFIFPTGDLSLAEVLGSYQYKRISALGVYWACFGSSGHLREPSGLVIENYRRRPPLNFHINRHIKSIVRGRQQSHVGPNSHMFKTPWGTQDELGRTITFGLTQFEPSYRSLRINHYVTQSLEFFKRFKQNSGAADAGSTYVRPDDWWTKHDHNNEFDESVQYLVAPLQEEMKKLNIPDPGLLRGFFGEAVACL
jgi:hypothetical protein